MFWSFEQFIPFLWMIPLQVCFECSIHAEHFFLIYLHRPADRSLMRTVIELGRLYQILPPEQQSRTLRAPYHFAAGKSDQVETHFLILEKIFHRRYIRCRIQKGRNIMALRDNQKLFMFNTMSLCSVEKECHDCLPGEGLFHLFGPFHFYNFRTCSGHRLVEKIPLDVLHNYFRTGTRKIGYQLYLFFVGTRNGSRSA